MTPQLLDPPAIFKVLSGATPFLGIAITFGVYFASVKVHRALGAPLFLHPLLIAIAAVAVSLYVMRIPYDHYFRAAEPLHLLLGPVVVLLAVPLWRQLAAIRALGPGLLVILFIGATTGIATSAGVALLLAAPGDLVSTLAPKSVTTPVAIKLSESLGGVPAITALVVILTGLVGATFGWPLLHALGIVDRRAKGFAIGVAAHAIGTARVFQIDEKAGAFSSLGMILNAIMTAALMGLATLAVS
jgi:predicted murein hydrolase (TIGR00659 family)